MCSYVETTNKLTERILELIPTHPEILSFESPWELFKVDGFKSNDLDPSFMQADFALQAARKLYTETRT